MPHWINSEGGPLLLLPSGSLLHWKGVRGTPGETDYDRACRIEDLLGVVSVGESSALVLGDEPLHTTWIPDLAGFHGLLVGWRYADSEDAVLRQLRDNLSATFVSSGVTFRSVERSHRLFDSALSGDRVRPNDALAIDLPVGTYEIDTAEFAPDDATALLLHGFRMR